MKATDVPTRSTHKSVRYYAGTFYSAAWDELFTPVSEREISSFWDRVESAEKKAGRALTNRELQRLVATMF